MLHDPSHRPPLPVAEEIELLPKDKEILRGLAGRLAEVGALPGLNHRANQKAGAESWPENSDVFFVTRIKSIANRSS
jgi:hypothetical protein